MDIMEAIRNRSSYQGLCARRSTPWADRGLIGLATAAPIAATDNPGRFASLPIAGFSIGYPRPQSPK